MNSVHKKSGFTLIELIVAVTIVGILAVIGLRSFTGALKKTRDGMRKSDLNATQKALESYYNDFGQYPAANSNGEIMGCGNAGDPVAAHTACAWGDEFSVGTAIYMEKLPADPMGNYYYYAPTSAGSVVSYFIFARLENLDDSAVAKNNAGLAIYRIPNAAHHLSNTVCRDAAEKDGCNYKVQSSNAATSGNVVLGTDN
jgi:prepilin-type N-terminal cleavage/methylation domain-containing protein